VSTTGLGRAPALYFVDVILGAPVEKQAEAVDSAWRGRFGDVYDKVSLGTRLLLAEWSAYRGDTLRLKNLRAAILSDTASTPLPLPHLLDGQLALARGDSGRAAESFRAMRVNVPAGKLEWELIEPLPLERLVLARNALAVGDAEQALRAASVFDHPSPIAYLPFLAAGLDLRLAAARRLGRRDLVARYESRLDRLRPAVEVAGVLQNRGRGVESRKPAFQPEGPR
jgi:hypothetical protein